MLRGHYTAYGDGNIGIAYRQLVSVLATLAQLKSVAWWRCEWDGDGVRMMGWE